MRKAITTVVAGVGLALCSQSLMAVGFGRLVNATTLGQSLDVAVALSADITEQITPECVGVDVAVGDSVLPHPAVQVRLGPPAGNGTRILRVTTTVRIQEPVVNLTLSVACPSRVSRQFVVFVDPPLAAAEPGVPVAVPIGPQAAATAPATAGAVDAAPEPVIARGAVDLARPDTVAPPPAPPATRPPRRSAKSSAAEAVSAQAPVARRAQAAARKARRGASTEARARSAAPRLELERGIGAAPAAPSAAAASAASEPAAFAGLEPVASLLVAVAASASAPADAERAAEGRRVAIESLQQRLDKLQIDFDVSSKNVAQLQARFRAAEAPGSAGWLLYALTAAGSALLLWIGLLVGRRAAASRPGKPWWSAEARPVAPTLAVGASAAPAFVTSARMPLPDVAERSDDAPMTDPIPLGITGALPLSDLRRASPVFGDTVAGVGTALAAPLPSAARLSADELIDLDQQSAFFVALGQDDAAIDLLNAFLCGNGGTSPLPYLKLLEIHRRRGEPEAHEKIRERHERRFCASAPGWDDGSGAALEHHTELLRQIESAWADPVKAMSLTESMLVGSDPSAASFGLSTFGDLQFLYQLALCVRELDEPAQASVDLLLPLSAEDEPRSVLAASRSTPSAIDLELDFSPSVADPKPHE